MTPREFIGKWRAADLKERSAAQEHFIDLCRLLDEPTPAEADPTGEWYCFERGASKLSGGRGWADVWKRGYFGWEYKGKRHDLKAAYVQLQQYAVALENPPLLVVCDLEQFWIYTHWTNTVQRVYQIALDDLHDANKRQMLKWVFTDPERLKPGITRQSLTEEAAQRFADLAQRLRANGHEAQAVAHFINRLVFCMFAEDVGLLPNQMFTRMLRYAHTHPDESEEMARDLFRGMRSGGRIGFEDVEWFNGGLFDSDEALPLDGPAILEILKAARLDWSEIDPSIFGTLFERGLDPDKRSQLGAHYTDRDKIMLLVEPVIIRPLQAEWEGVRAPITAQLDKARTSKGPAATKARKAAQTLYNGFLERLRQVRILDPACGSGNFLYLGLQALKDFEHRVNVDAEALGLDRQFPAVGPECVQGIEINLFAAELARTTVWIGEIQWMRRNGFDVSRRPILRPLHTVECRDALLNLDGSEAVWPEAEFIVGNPPFLGDKKQLAELGEDYVATLRQTYAGRVPGGADLVCYWFEKARAQIEAGRAQRAGLVATNSIRQKRNRPVLERIRETGGIFHAWSDEEWVNEGAAVRVSLICFGDREHGQPVMLDGRPVREIYPDLAGADEGADELNLTQARTLPENAGRSFFGLCLAGAFAVDSDTARRWLRQPNPHGRPNSEVLRPIWNGVDITQGWKGRWVIDFGTQMTEKEAALYEAPFAQVLAKVKPVRMINNRKARAIYWWRHGETRPGLRGKLDGLSRYIATPETAKHRFFVWFPISVAPEHSLIVIPCDDDTTFGVLSSRLHITWAIAKGGRMGYGNDPRYNSTLTFETFPFPEGLTPNIPAADYAADPRAQAIAQAARRLNELRENWLNPPEWVRYEPEVVPGYPDRLVPVDDKAAALLKKRTLTNLYNERPAWLANVHRDLDAAVAAAYGWPADLGDDEILRRLLALNLERT